MPVEGIEVISRQVQGTWLRRYQTGWSDLALTIGEEWTVLSEYDPRADAEPNSGCRWPTWMMPSVASMLREVFQGLPEYTLSDPDDEENALDMIIQQHMAQITGRGEWALKASIGAPPQLWLAIGVDIMLLANDEEIKNLPTKIIKTEEGIEELLNFLT